MQLTNRQFAGKGGGREGEVVMDQGVKGWIERRAVADPAAAARAPSAPVSAPPEPVRSEATFVDQGAEFNGTLRLRDSFRIDCEFRGEIVSEGRVVVGETAGIEANIEAREIVIAGAVVGNVKASRQVVLRAGARLHGDVETPCFELEKGAFFNGRTSMANPVAGLRDGSTARSGARGNANPGYAAAEPAATSGGPPKS